VKQYRNSRLIWSKARVKFSMHAVGADLFLKLEGGEMAHEAGSGTHRLWKDAIVLMVMAM